MVSDLVEKGLSECRNKAYENGIAYFNRALDKEPAHIEALYNRAKALSRIGQISEALLDYKKLTELAPQNATFIGDYAVSLHLNGQNNEATVQFDYAISLEPQNPYRFASRAYFKNVTGDHEGAIKDYERAIELDPDDAISLNNKGLIEEQLGRKKKAEESFSKSNDLVGYNPETKSLKENKPVKRGAQKFDDKWSVVKSIFSHAGFKDFIQFSREKIFKKNN